MAFIKKLEFGNYTLKFGENKVLLDLFDEIVMPSFQERKYTRSIKDQSDYFFIDTEIVKLNSNSEEPVIGIAGKIVKNSKLHRDQIYTADDGLVENKKELETAPSSTFLLILNNHRLILCKEVAGAPDIRSFQSTSEQFLRARVKEYINEEFDVAEKNRKKDPNLPKVTKKSLRLECPTPQLRITPLPDKETLKEFLSRFEQVNKVTIKLLPTNKEDLDNDDFWSYLDNERKSLNTEASAKVEFSNSKCGLDNLGVLDQARSASCLGNSDIKLNGISSAGDKISGSNDDFNLTIELDSLSRDAKIAATEKYRQFIALANENVVKLPNLAVETIQKIKNIFGNI